MTWEQLNGWRRYYESDPWGQERQDIRQEVLRLRLLHAFSGGDEYSAPPFAWPHDASQAIKSEFDELDKAAAESLERWQKARQSAS